MRMFLLLTLAYLTVHVLVYFLLLREYKVMRHERGIFRYHFFSAVVIGLVALAAIAEDPNEVSFATAAGMMALHGLYSISFLEFWSLAQGSYSLSILQWAATGNQSRRTQSLNDLAANGDGKRVNRLGSLNSLGLVCEGSGLLSLTIFGRILTKFLKLMVRLTNMRSLG